ncbi:MAG: amino acid ABC transporter substrate-binding protein [Selenomonadaceae bacterium]|nr:amino acid ABC transporter substrate-binding protein [Selenomonadaceae bacterium]
MKKIFLVAMLLTTMIFTGCGGGDTPKTDGANADGAKKIVVGLDDEYPPMGFKDDKNEIIGFDVDLAKAAAKKLGREVEFKAIDWNSKEAELKSGRIDVLWNGLDITPERKENMLFSDPYMDNRQIIFIRKGDDANANISDENGLAGKSVGTQAGSTAEAYITGNDALKNSFKDFKTYGDYISAFMDLENGRLDAVVCDEIVGRYYMAKHADKIDAINVVVGPTSEFGIAFAKDNTALRDEVQKAFDEIVADGTAKKISEEWFGADLIKNKNQE